MVTLRQHKVATSNTADHTSFSATFDSAPLSGSLLVASASYQGFPGSDVKTASVPGFTTVRQAISGAMAAFGAAKLAGSSESSTVTVNLDAGDTTGSSSLIISEFTGTFDSLSVSNAVSDAQGYAEGTAFTTKDCPPLDLTGTYLVMPMLALNGTASDPTINLAHTLIAHARPGTDTWHRALAVAHKNVTDDAAHAPAWSWTTGVTSATLGQMAFPLSAGGGAAVDLTTAAQTPAVELEWSNNGDGPFKVVRDGTTLQSGIAGTSYVDTSVTAGNSYVYRIEDDSLVQSDPETVNVTSTGVFFLRRTETGWSSDGS